MILIFALTLFVSAGLLFVVQPMVGKMILPSLGGTPAVWNTCMVFFQAILLAGYLYAHGSVAWLGVRRQRILHILVMLLPLAFLPISLATGDAPPADASPTGWLLLRLLTIAGLPIFVVCSSAPLLQKWFSQTGHPAADDPYFLYGASNFGSLLALLGYPFLIEPLLPLSDQGEIWKWAYVVLIGLVAICAATVRRPRFAVQSSRQSAAPDSPAPSLALRTRWVCCAAVASSLLLGVTTHITTDIAAVPLLWVLPLALYLLTFILVFARRPFLSHRFNVRIFPYAILMLSPLIFYESTHLTWLSIPLHLLMFFNVAMVCHGELMRTRPTAQHLTAFYLWMSFGGVLGGCFNAIVAPLVFDSILEYPLMLALACFLVPPLTAVGTTRPVDDEDYTAPPKSPRWVRRDLIFPAALAVFAAIAIWVFCNTSWRQTWQSAGVLITVCAMVCFASKERPLRFALSVSVYLVAMGFYSNIPTGDLVYAGRNFFGVKRVLVTNNGLLRKFVHGTTNHGMQWMDDARRNEPTAYYYRGGPVGDLMRDLRAANGLERVAVVGLGAGAMACYVEPDQHFTFYEIDPDVARIARDPNCFTFLKDCRGTLDVILGDGRIALSAADDGAFDLIMLDAFSSDSVPTHLLSREALRLYLSKLKPHGAIAYHISNGYLNLQPVIARLAADAGLIAYHRRDYVSTDVEHPDGRLSSHFVIVARREKDLGTLVNAAGWRLLPNAPDAPLWTDQYCNIVELFLAPSRPTKRSN